MRRGLIALVVLVAMQTTAHAEESWPPEGGTVIDAIAALVGKEPITQREVAQATIALIQSLRANGEAITEA